MVDTPFRLLTQRSIQFRTPAATKLFFTLGTVLAVTGLLVYFELARVPLRQYYRYITLLPVFYIAYQSGWQPGLATSFFFSSAFLPLLYLTTRDNFLSPQNFEVIAYVLIINTFGYVVADIARSIRTHQALSSAVRDWEALLSRISVPEEVIKFILEQSQSICMPETAIILMRNPLDAQWEINTLTERIPLPLSEDFNPQRQNLAEWLLDQERALVLNHLDKPSSLIFPQTGSPGLPLHSLLAHPLRHRDGTLMALLVLVNKKLGEFSKSDLQALGDLIAGGEGALEQAGLYARTDHALARRVRQLAAIQRTARVLNATLDPKQIIERTLECALEITNGEAGLISLEMKCFPPIVQALGARLDDSRAPLLAQQARELERAGILPLNESGPSLLLPEASSRLAAPIKREDQTLGMVIVESSTPRIFKEASRHVLTILADHAATALENARLFQEIQMEQERVSLIIHSIADGLFTTDTDGVILTFNPAAERLTGWTEQEAIGRMCCEVFGCSHETGQEQQECALLHAQSQPDGASEERFVIRQRSGTKRVILLSLAPLPATGGKAAGSVFLFRDITEQDEMDRLQKELVAAISHELRGPLSHISTITETLMSQTDEVAIRPYAKHFSNLMKQTQRLADFADRILDVYRLETGKLGLQLRPLPVCLLVEEIINQWQGPSQQHRFNLQLPQKSPWIWADENAFHTVLNNLVDNAAKYSLPGAPIDIIVNEASGGFVTCAVQDYGPGVAPEHQTRIFDRFYRVNGGDAQLVYGHGFGLYMAKNLIEAMKGQIWVESEYGKGSYFAFSLPIMEASNAGKDLAG